MVHVLYAGDVHSGEAVKAANVRPLLAFRVKTKTGRYFHVLAGSQAEAQAWVKAQDGGAEAPEKE